MPEASAPLSAIAGGRLFFFRQISALPASRSELPTSLRRSELQIFRMILIAITPRLCKRACRSRVSRREESEEAMLKSPNGLDATLSYVCLAWFVILCPSYAHSLRVSDVEPCVHA